MLFAVLFPNVCLQEMEYNALEEKLQKTLFDLEKREKQLDEAELEVRFLKILDDSMMRGFSDTHMTYVFWNASS